MIFVKCALFALLIFLTQCTKLHEKFNGDLSADQVANGTNTTALLNGVYNSMEVPFVLNLTTWALDELTTDAAIAPTRGQDWDDNGSWRALHQQKWNALNPHVRDVFNGINGVSFLATDMLQYKPTSEQEGQARFLRAYAMYFLLDLYNQVPYRDPGESQLTEARVRTGLEALDYIVSELNAIEPMLPDGPAGVANKYADKALLMKIYLNKAIYVNRANPTFDPEDMNRVISLADEIINSGKFHFTSDYFDNFAPANTSIGYENIFTQFHDASTPNNTIFFTFFSVMHYSSIPPGQNGFTTLSDFYDKFESTDDRRGEYYVTTGSPPNPGKRINVGFFEGQQYNLFNDDSLTDRSGAPLTFTREVNNIETGANLESTGIRAVKYEPDFSNGFSSLFSPDNDYVYFRLADVLLMKAEAIMRGGTGTPAGNYGSDALSIVNYIRTDPSRGASKLSSLNKDQLLEERGRELWWEGWRRQDMIRFGTFLNSFQQKEYVSDSKYLLFPIPEEQIGVNHNLKQNPGY